MTQAAHLAVNVVKVADNHCDNGVGLLGVCASRRDILDPVEFSVRLCAWRNMMTTFCDLATHGIHLAQILVAEWTMAMRAAEASLRRQFSLVNQCLVHENLPHFGGWLYHIKN